MATAKHLSTDDQDFPQGIGIAHFRPGLLRHYPNLLALLFWTTVLLLALLGIFGGQPHPKLVSSATDADMTIALPQHLRNGEFFEMRFYVHAKRDIDDATLEISQSYLKDLTINTMIPAPDKEAAVDGIYRFSFGALKAGEKLHVKVDGQINPPLFGGTSGRVKLLDGIAR